MENLKIGKLSTTEIDNLTSQGIINEVITDTIEYKNLLSENTFLKHINSELLAKIDELTSMLREFKEMSKPLSMVEAIKFARQAYYDGDSSSYGVPNSFDIAFLYASTT